MEEPTLQSPLQKLRQELSGRLRHLPDYKIIELCQDYGISYEIPDANTIRIIMLLCAAEQLILDKVSNNL